jgi:type IV secretion system protein VirD4
VTIATPPTAQPVDDWSALTIPAVSAGAASGNGNGVSIDPANAGIRREPELPEHEKIAPLERLSLSEFDVLDDDPDVDAARASRLRQQVTSNARQAAMDPADGLEL